MCFYVKDNYQYCSKDAEEAKKPNISNGLGSDDMDVDLDGAAGYGNGGPSEKYV